MMTTKEEAFEKGRYYFLKQMVGYSESWDKVIKEALKIAQDYDDVKILRGGLCDKKGCE